MSLTLPPVGTNRLLELLSPYAPDDFIAEVCPRSFTGGRRHALSAAQLWRTHLLAVLTSTHSLNLLVTQLPEQVAWRRFARLRHTLPTARMLHEFREAVGVGGLRAINQHLVGRLLRRAGVQPHAVALMDATDLPAACGGFKKKFRQLHGRARGAGRAHAQDGPEPLVRWLQETHVAVVAVRRANDGSGGSMNRRAGNSGFACPPDPNCVRTVGRPPTVRDILDTPWERTRHCWDCCRWPAAWRNGCCGKSGRGSNPRSPLRKTSWAWGGCFSTVCV